MSIAHDLRGKFIDVFSGDFQKAPSSWKVNSTLATINSKKHHDGKILPFAHRLTTGHCPGKVKSQLDPPGK
jgi:hypothetical protein